MNLRRLLLPVMLPLVAATCGATESAPEDRFALPPPEAELPGDGPFRREDWFAQLWKERRQSFAQQAAAQQGALVFLGDSITHWWGEGLTGAFAGTPTANRGIAGDTSRGVLYRLPEDVLALRPRGVVLLIGTNDIGSQADPDVIASNVEQIITRLQAQQPAMPIILCEVFPSAESMSRPAERIRALNARYRELAQRHDHVTLLPMWEIFANEEGDARPEEFPDLLHPNEAGYARWAAALQPVLRRLGLLEQ